MVRCGDSSTSEFVPLRTTVIAQTLDNEAFSRGRFFGSQTHGDKEGNDKVGSPTCGPENADTASSGGVRGVETGSNSSANEVATTNVTTRGGQHSLDLGFEHVESVQLLLRSVLELLRSVWHLQRESWLLLKSAS